MSKTYHGSSIVPHKRIMKRRAIDTLVEAADTARRAGLDKIEAIEAVSAGVRKYHIGINYKVTYGDVVRAVSAAYMRPSSLSRR